MSDLIYRQAAIDAVGNMLRRKFGIGGDLAEITIAGLPSAETSFGWCTDCKEYDKEAHCCHRFSSVIRDAIDELQLVRCRDCKSYVKHDKRCKVWNHGVAEYEYCYRGWKE